VPFVDQTLGTDAIAGNGSHEIRTTYTLYATNQYGRSQATVTVNVP